MSGISKLEGCPWHLEKLQRKDDRRHNHNCAYFKDGKCNTIKSLYYDMNCGGSAHCMYYKEVSEDEKLKKKNSKKIVKNNEPYWFD